MQQTSAKTLEERLLELEAREQIKEIIANYNHGVDKLDEELFMDQWEEDAVWDIGDPWGVCNGKQEILEKIRAIWQGLPECHHYGINEVIKVDIQNGTATSVSDVDCTATNYKGVPLVIAATNWDQYSNKTGKWRFTERKIKIHYMTPVLEPWSDKPESRINPKLD